MCAANKLGNVSTTLLLIITFRARQTWVLTVCCPCKLKLYLSESRVRCAALGQYMIVVQNQLLWMPNSLPSFFPT